MKISSAAPAVAHDEEGWRKRRRSPVQWLSVTELLRTGREAARGTEFARYADQRETQAHAPEQIYDLSRQGTRQDYVMDYLADTGDGFDATYAVAASVNGHAGGTAAPEGPADLLVLGGDEVYPIGSVREYTDRLEMPFERVRPAMTGERQRVLDAFVLALPGNHDWYDGLVAFRRNFCESWLQRLDTRGAGSSAPPLAPVTIDGIGDDYLNRWAFQSRSYWAVKLPHGWWLWGLDSQLDAHIDAAQIAYFLRARELVQDDERVILCTARPSWTDLPARDEGYWTSNREVLIWFLDRMFGRSEDEKREECRHQVPLLLTGDKHHYVHYQRVADQDAASPSHLVTCGGGGAYLSSTHHVKDEVTVPWHFGAHEDQEPTAYHRERTFPSADESRSLRGGWWQIPLLNGPVTPALVGGIDLLLTCVVFIGLSRHTLAGWVPYMVASVLVLGLLVAMSVLFRRPGVVPWKGTLPGIAHTVAHLAVAGSALLISAALQGLRDGSWHLWGDGLPLGGSLVALVLVTAWCVLAGNLVFAAYFRVSDSFGFHENESFSAMHIQHYKSHLRLTFHPSAAGTGAGPVTVAVLGLRTVPEQPETPDPATVEVELVESFTV